MKKTFTYIIGVAILFFATMNIQAGTIQNITSNTVNTVNTVTQSTTNINQAVASILMGINGAGSEVFGASKQAIGQSIAFVQAQAPDIIHQFLAWRFTEALLHTIGGVIGLIILGCIAILIRKYWSHSNEEDILILMPGLIVCPIPVYAIYSNVLIMAQIWIAPKIYLIDYITSLVKH